MRWRGVFSPVIANLLPLSVRCGERSGEQIGSNNNKNNMKNTCNSFSVNVGDRVIFTDDDGAEHQATVLRVDGTLLLAFDDGDEGWESAIACRAAAR